MNEYYKLLSRYGVSTPELSYAGIDMPTDETSSEYAALLDKYEVDKAQYDAWLAEYQRRKKAFDMYGPDYQGELLGKPTYTYGYDYTDPSIAPSVSEIPSTQTPAEVTPIIITNSGGNYSGASGSPSAGKNTVSEASIDALGKAAGWAETIGSVPSLGTKIGAGLVGGLLGIARDSQIDSISQQLADIQAAQDAGYSARTNADGSVSSVSTQAKTDALDRGVFGITSEGLDSARNNAESMQSMQDALNADTNALNGMSGGYDGGSDSSNGSMGGAGNNDGSRGGQNSENARGGLIDLHNKYAKGGTVRKFSFGGVAEDPAVAHSPGYIGGGQDLSPELRAAILQDARANGIEDPRTAFTGGSSYGYSPAPAQTAPEPQLIPSQAAEELNYAAEMRAARQEYKTAQEQLNQMLRQAMEQKSEPPSKAELYFQLAAAFAAPTKTGSFGESMGEASKVLGEHQKAIRAGSSADRANKLQIGLEIAKQRALGSKEDIQNLRALTVEEMKARRLQMEPKSEIGKQALDEGLQPGTPQFVARVAGTNTENQGLKLTAEQLKKDAAQLALEREQRAKMQAGMLSPTELKLKAEAEDKLTSIDVALSKLQEAAKLNPKTFGSSWGDLAQKYMLNATNPTHPQALASQKVDNLLGSQGVEQLKATFGGQISDGERQMLLSLQGIGAKSKEERQFIIENAIQTLAQRRAKEAKRLEAVTTRAYRTPETVTEGAQ